MSTLTEPAFPELHESLQDRLAALLDLGLTLKHIHWNVVGPNFISVHEMLDDMVAKVRPMSDAVAERLRTLGGMPVGTPKAIVDTRSWEDYPLGQDLTTDHLKALDAVFSGVIEDHRAVVAKAGDVDPITEDLLIGQTAELELMQWFVRSFLHRSGADDAADRETVDA